jgi:metal-responsive CopG/Arc/MetJ family transcriptional regulator
VFTEELKLANFRMPVSLLAELDEARFALGKATIAELVRQALRAYLDANAEPIKAYRKLREKHPSRGEP